MTMKNIILCAVAALALAACETTSDKSDMTESVTKTEAMEMVCAIENPDGTCACEVVDENGDCTEGGGSGVIIPAIVSE